VQEPVSRLDHTSTSYLTSQHNRRVLRHSTRYGELDARAVQADRVIRGLDDSPFFSLPLEIRNSIYEYALGDESRTLSHNGDLVVAVPQFPPRVLSREDREAIFSGLPAWILTCKELCAEAVDVFIRTRAYESISPHSIVNDRGLPVAQPDAKQTIWDLLKSMNPLIFKADGIQIIALRPSGATGYS
jgi:hypothetical protein